MIVFVRHGETVANREGRFLGRADPPLTRRGEQQMHALAAALAAEDVAAVLTSPLARAQVTARAIGDVHGLEPQADDRLLELDYGDWDGKAFDAVPADAMARWRDDVAFVPPGGESLQAVADRMRRFCCDWLGEGVVVAVSHVSPIKAAVAWALRVGSDVTWRMRLDLASITRIAGSPSAPVLLSFNETAHLAAATT